MSPGAAIVSWGRCETDLRLPPPAAKRTRADDKQPEKEPRVPSQLFTLLPSGGRVNSISCTASEPGVNLYIYYVPVVTTGFISLCIHHIINEHGM